MADLRPPRSLMSIQYTSADPVEFGLPLGGLGCGSLQIFPDGTRGQFTGLNNWAEPLGPLHWFRAGTAADYRVANPFGLFVEHQGHRLARLLQTQPLADLPTVRAIRFQADFPIAELTIDDPDLPLGVSVTVFSSFVPGHEDESGLPGVIYRWRLHNPQRDAAVASLLCCVVNPIGAWNVSRYNTVIKREGLIGIECRRRHPRPGDERQGTVVLMTPQGRPRAEVSYWGSWMYAGSPFSAHQQERRLDAWPAFARDGRLPNDAVVREAHGERDEPMGALAIRLELPPGATVEWPVYYAWHAPRHHLGHRYAKDFSSAWSVGRHLHRRRRRLWDRTLAWQAEIRRAAWPAWLSDGLINSLCVYTAASWWTRKGAFAVVENPIKWPLMDSLDVRYYGTLPLALLFPRLERSTLTLFRDHQRPDGRIPHDLGKAQLNCPSDGTTAGVPWKDLSPKYALMVYRNALWTQDRAWVKGFYPSVKRAMLWQLATDANRDGLPDNAGRDCTYDLWDFFGTSSYTACLHLAALRATEELARMAGDRDFALRCHAAYGRGAVAFDEQLWTGSYYRAARQADGLTYEACIAGQLNGQWYAHLLGLGYLLPRQRVRQAVQTMLRLNAGASEFGAVNAVFPNGRIDDRSWHSANIWVGESYALAALAIYEGFVEEGMALAGKTWRNLADHVKRPWSQPDVVAASDGRPGDGEFYIRNVAIWAVAFALAHRDAAARRTLKSLVPALPAAPLARRRLSAVSA